MSVVRKFQYAIMRDLKSRLDYKKSLNLKVCLNIGCASTLLREDGVP